MVGRIEWIFSVNLKGFDWEKSVRVRVVEFEWKRTVRVIGEMQKVGFEIENDFRRSMQEWLGNGFQINKESSVLVSNKSPRKNVDFSIRQGMW